jgi:hypothetical protein
VRTAPLALLALLLAPGALAFEAPPASPLLRPDHWAVQAAGRLEELGLVERYMPAQRAVPILAVARVLAEAEERARTARPDLAPLVAAWRERFEREWSGAARAAEGPRILGAQLGAGYQDGSVREASLGPPPTRQSALFLQAHGSDPFAAGEAAAAYGTHLAAGLSVRATPWRVTLPSLEVVGALGSVALSVGRTAVGYGSNEHGGVVATGAAAIGRVELMTTAPCRLPRPHRALGDFAFDTAFARFDERRHPTHPFLWQLQLQWRPHPRLTFGAARGLMLGGSFWRSTPKGDVPLILAGIKGSHRENNVYSLGARLRLPTEALLPLTAKVEWGSDDNPGAAVQWPGLVVGVTAPMLPGLPAAVGVEYAYFGDGPFGYHDPFPWYGHGGHVGGWATGQTPLGDPLGGNGQALRLIASVDPFDARVRIAAVGWIQDRDRDNLYSPAAGGESLGLRGEAELRLGRGAVGLRGSYEHGSAGWTRSEIEIAGRVFF